VMIAFFLVIAIALAGRYLRHQKIQRGARREASPIETTAASLFVTLKEG
jgi:Kef-type K+ transport system membrane component KefB